MVIFDQFRTALGRYGVALTPAPTVLADLTEAGGRGWTMRDLALACLDDWPDNVRSPAALIRSRLMMLASTDPDPRPSTPTPPRWQSSNRVGSPMPDDVRIELHGKKWWRTDRT